MTQTPAGWYPDPESTDQQRYWDGSQWTEHRAPVQPTYQPPAYQPPSYPDPAQQAGQAPSYQQPGQAPTYQQPGYPVGFQPYQAPSQSHTTRNVLIIIGVIFVLLVGGCFAVVGVAAKSVNDAVDDASVPHDVTYRVTGTASSASVTYTDGRVSSDTESTVTLPFEKKVRIDGSIFNFYSLSASSVGDGSVSCEILVDGKSVDTETSDESFGFVLCDHSE